MSNVATTAAGHPVFCTHLRVYYADTDAEGVVYHSNYLDFMDRARTEWLRALGYGQATMAAQGFLMAVHSASLRYLAPARLDDELTVTASVKEARATSLIFMQQILRKNDAALLCEGDVRVTRVRRESFTSEVLPPGFVAGFFQPL